jgi:hypothetical protein
MAVSNLALVILYQLGHICYNGDAKTGWRSILVSTAASQDGPKNPLKGISMKFLVPARCAQRWVGAGS